MPRILAAFLIGCLAVTAAPTLAAETVAATAPNQAKTDSWPQMMRDSAHSSVSPDQKLSAATASTIGLNWMSAMRSADLGSPVAATNTVLGKTVVYVGDERGDVIAYDESVGTTLWSSSIGAGDSERSSPLIAPDGSIWVATAESATIFKLDGATGQVLCSYKAPMRFNSSLMYASPPGGVPTVYTATNHSSLSSGPEIALAEGDCSKIWTFDKWLTLSGAWATPAYGVDANGKGRVFIGTADPDSTLYSVDALTGKPQWNYSALNPPDGTFDVGAAATVSAPGNNGFADGVVYFPSKYGVMYALDMGSGKLIWQYNFNKPAHVTEGGRSAAALYDNTLVYGMADGVEAVNAKTGALLWHHIDPAHTEVLSSPAVAGPPGQEIVAYGDVTGLFTVLRLSDGKALYSYQTSNYITASPAIVNGHILIASTDGFVYDFTTGGGNVASPTTAITSPKTGSVIANPGATVTVTGTATDGTNGGGLTELQLSVQRGGPTGPWYDAATGTWLGGPANNFVPVANPRKPQSPWTFSFPVLAAGSTYQVFVNAVNLFGQVDRVGAQSSFTVQPTQQSPQLSLSSTVAAPTATVLASGGPFAPNEVVSFVLQKAAVGQATASSNGVVTNATIKIPANADFGPSSLSATGQTSHKASSATIDVANVWAQSGYDATNSGYEPHDSVLASTLQSTHEGYISRAWLFATGAEVDAPPAIVAGLAYVANAAGTLTAVDTASGAPIWSYTVPTNAPIHGAPAVGNGAVVIGADDGSLYTVSSATGAFLGSVALDGVPTSPKLLGGTIYVGTDNGTVYAIDEASGNQLWSTPVGAAIHMSPAIDTAAGALFVGDDAGNVTTLNVATGAQTGQVTTGGAAVTVAPEVASGALYVGASDGFVRSFNETSGKLNWKYKAGAPVHALANIGSYIYVGSDNGVLAKIDQRRGSVVFTDSSFGSGLVGIGHSAGVSVVETSSGHINALKDDQGGRIQFDYATGKGLNTQPAIVDGGVFVGAQDGGLYAFTNHGQAPEDAIVHLMLQKYREKAKTFAAWAHPHVAQHAVVASRAFEPYGPRTFPLLMDRPSAPGAARQTATIPAGAAARTYLLAWSPVPIRATAFAARARAIAGSVAGSVVDTSPYPRVLDDAAIQRELAKAIATNRWQVTAGTRFLVLTAAPPVSATTYCGYRSAFYLGGDLGKAAIYGVVPAGLSEECGAFDAQLSRAWNLLQVSPAPR